MDWKHNDNGTTILEIVMNKSKMTEEELLHPKYTSPYDIEGMGDALEILLDAIDAHIPITIVGDYDADGITSTTILMELLHFLGAKPRYRLPKRVSEGYGISNAIIDEIKDGIVLTIDNGIAAVDAIRLAKEKELTVIVMDHHLPQDTLPDADVIVDPHVHPDKNGYEHYCGAGLALKLSEMALEAYDTEPSRLLKKRATALAAIGTIADVMPLTGDNRRIVKEGLYIMEKERKALSAGLKAIMDESGMYAVTETDIGFKIGPMLNAPGRLMDDGAKLSVEALLCNKREEATARASEITALNEQRKSEVTEAFARIERIVAEECLYNMNPLCVVDPNLKEGLVGIVTGKLAEKFKRPCFVFTQSSESGILKGSGRSYGDIDLMNIVLAASSVLHKYGGHTGAAGISVKEEDYADMIDMMSSVMADIPADTAEEILYDLEIKQEEIKQIHFELQKYAPFGEGNPALTFRINDILLSPRVGNYYKMMGKNMEHLKLLGNGFSMVCFNMANRYTEMGLPMKVSVVGKIAENVFQYAKEIQIEVADFAKCEHNLPTTSLLEALKANGTI